MIKAKIVFTGSIIRPPQDIMLAGMPDKTHDFMTNDGQQWSVVSITWVQESVSPPAWCLCIKLKKA